MLKSSKSHHVKKMPILDDDNDFGDDPDDSSDDSTNLKIGEAFVSKQLSRLFRKLLTFNDIYSLSRFI